MFALRPAAASDLAPVVALLESCALPRADVERDFPTGFVVAELAERVVGVAGVEIHGASGLLRSVAVAGAHRGRGLARTLTLDRLAWARSRELADVWLLTTTAAALFARLGFAETARASAPRELSQSAEFARTCPASATCMRLALVAVDDGRPDLRCPACGCPEVQVTPGRASTCTPMPPIDVLRCPRCDNSGTRVRLRGGATVRWDRGPSPH